MARITIEITDSIQSSVVKKIKEIGDTANLSQEAVDQLNKSLKDINYKGFDKAVSSIESLNRAQLNLLKSQEQLAQAYSNTAIRQTKANTEDEKYKRQIEIGNIELQRRKAILEATSKVQSIKQAQAQINLATQAEKNAIAINRQNVALQTASEKLKQAEFRTEQLENASKKTALSLFSLTNIFRALALIRIAEQAFNIVDAYTLMQNRLKLVSDSVDNTTSLQKEMFKIANDTRVPVEELTQSFVRYDYALKGLGASQRESLRFTKTLTETLAISGLTTQEQSSALLQLSQALNKGKLDGDEFRTIMETLPTLATAIAKQMGVARGELLKLAPQGKITASVIREAMASIADDTDRAFKNLVPTIGQSFTVLKNNIIELIGQFNESTGASKLFSDSILLIAKNIGILSSAIAVAGIAFATQFVPKIIAGINAIGVAGAKLLLNPIFLIPAALAAVYLLIKNEEDKRNAAIDAQAERDNAKYDAFQKQQEQRRKSLLYETEATIKLKNEYGKYLIVLAETNDAKEKGFISDKAQKALLAETEIVKGRTKSLDLINNKPESVLLDSEIVENQRKKIKDEYDKALVDSENYIRASSTLRNENDKLQIESAKKINGLKFSQAILNRQLEDLEKNNPQEDSIFHNVTNQINALKLKIKLNEDLINQETNNFNTEFKNGETLTTNLKEEIDLQGKLKKSLEEKLGILARIGVLKIKAEIKNSDSRLQDEYNNTLAATNELVKEGNINEAKKAILLSNTSKIREIMRTKEKVDAFEYKTESQKRLEAINKETEETLRLVDANVKLYGSTQSYNDARKRVLEGSARQKEDLKKEVDRSSLVATGGSIDNVRIDEINREEQRYKDYQKTIASLQQDELKNKNLTLREVERIGEEYRARELKAKKEHEDKLSAIDNDAVSKRLSIYGSMFGSLSELAAEFAKDGKKGAKEMFYISQGLALASATVNTASAISGGLATPPAPNYGAAIAAGLAGAVQIAAITSATIKGFAKGQVSIGGTGTSTSDSMLAYIGRGESVINSRSTARHKNILEAINADNGSSTSNINNTYLNNNGGGGKAPTINIINNTGGKIGENTKYNQETNTLDVQIDYIEAKLAQKYADGNGKLAKAIDTRRKQNY